MSDSLELIEALKRARALLEKARVPLDQRPIALDSMSALDRALTDLTDPGAVSEPRSAADERMSRVEAEAGHRRAAFAYEVANALFDHELDAGARLARFGKLVVPDVADWCLCELTSPSGSPERFVHTWNPEKASLADTLLPMLEARPLHELVASGAARIAPSTSVDEVRSTLGEAFATVGAKSVMVFPLSARKRVLGAVAFVFAESSRVYNDTDRALAEDLVQRAATAVDNARLFAELQQSLRSRDEMVGIVSHDLRNPLSTMKLAATLLAEEVSSSASATKRVAMIARAANRMETLLGDLLDVTALEAGGLKLEISSHPLAGIVSDSAEVVHGAAAAKSVTVSAEPGPDVPVMCDRERVLQVLSNLLGNAVKFTPAGGKVTVSSRDAGNMAVISVADTGAGIAADQLPHVFDRFYQAKRKGREGAGLGLSIVKGLVEAHGGTVSMTSEVGKGTVVSFTLLKA